MVRIRSYTEMCLSDVSRFIFVVETEVRHGYE
jgi:hypothetical protein